MPKVVYVQNDGARRQVEVPVGQSVMQGATRNGIAGIDAECGGACACATCHVYVEPEWRQRAGAPEGSEADMLDYAVDVDPQRSRLSCQIAMRDDLDGLVVIIPRTQQ